MNAEVRKRLEEMQAEARTVPLSEKERWLIARLEAEAAEVERLTVANEVWHLRVGQGNTEKDALIAERVAAESDAAQLRKDCEDMAYATGDMATKLVAAETSCQSLVDQSSRWEAQALEAETPKAGEGNPKNESKEDKVGNLEEELAVLLNRFSAENESDTPVFVLAAYLNDCLDAFNRATKLRRFASLGVRIIPRPHPQPGESAGEKKEGV